MLSTVKKGSNSPQFIKRKLNEQVYDNAIELGLDPIVSRILSARGLNNNLPLEQIIFPKLQYLSAPKMQDMEIASQRLAKAIISQECIGVETDHDCDGQTSHAIIVDNLVRHFKHPKEKIRSYIGHRLEEGYGLSLPVANRILADNPRPTLIITADNGSTDEPRIALLKEQGIDVIVTDHHQIPCEGVPKSAFATINPTREDCCYPDSCIAGCMVAWLLMTATRNELIIAGYCDKTIPKLADTLDFVAVGTVADCVSMARSQNNRAVVQFGLKLINQGTRHCWQVLKEHLGGEITSEGIGFGIGPLLNSDGRLSNAFKSVSFLLSDDIAEANNWLATLCEQNDKRKQIQNDITSRGMKVAWQQAEQGDNSIREFLENGHSGVHGISASRLKDSFGRPVVFMARKLSDPNLITGSLRGIDGFDIKKSLDYINKQDSSIFEAFGGHEGAGGITIKAENLKLFMSKFEKFCSVALTREQIGPKVYVDDELNSDVSLALLNSLETLEPFGREFEQPVFTQMVTILQLRWVGNGTHLRVQFCTKSGQPNWGIWFSARHSEDDTVDLVEGNKVKLVFSVKKSTFSYSRIDYLIKGFTRVAS
ncbi:MAG: single-stranded-DNA-specific exonuclease RecJ [Francisellaceae bacterium]|nr:single-stranded-DNA-specific exonuclease RecJ [Francisellaceae bacterium]